MIDTKTGPYGALVLRLSLGIMFLAHALLKIFVFTPEGSVGFFQSVGLPGFLAYLAIFAEIIAGVALILGIATRSISLAMIPLLLGTIIFVHGGNGWLFANEGGGWEYPAFLIAASLAQALIGGGAYSLYNYSSPKLTRA